MGKLLIVLITNILLVLSQAAKIDEILQEIKHNVNSRVMSRLVPVPQNAVKNETELENHHHTHFPAPTFLKKVSAIARKEFYEIVHDRDISRTEMKQQLEEWAVKQGSDIQYDLKMYFEKIRETLRDWHQKTLNVLQELPKAYDQVHNILNNPSLSSNEVEEALQALKLSSPVSHSLRYTMFFAVHPTVNEDIDMIAPAKGILAVDGGYDFGNDLEKKAINVSEKKKTTAKPKPEF